MARSIFTLRHKEGFEPVSFRSLHEGRMSDRGGAAVCARARDTAQAVPADVSLVIAGDDFSE